MLLLVLMLLFAALFVVVPPANRALGAATDRGDRFVTFVLLERPASTFVLAGVFLGLLVALWLIAPARRAAEVGHIRFNMLLVLAGSVLWLASQLLAPHAGGAPLGHDPVVTGIVVIFMPLLAGLSAFFGLRGIIQALGRRSRQFRTARGSRQYVRDLIAALVAVAIGEMLRQGADLAGWHGVAVVGSVIVWVAGALLILGQCYLVWNTWWIRRALLRPPPTLTELVRTVHDE